MFHNPELMKTLMDERQRSIARESRQSRARASHPSTAPASHVRPAPQGLPAARVRARPAGPPAYYRGIAVSVWRAALLRRTAAALATTEAQADRGRGPVQLCW